MVLFTFLKLFKSLTVAATPQTPESVITRSLKEKIQKGLVLEDWKEILSTDGSLLCLSTHTPKRNAGSGEGCAKEAGGQDGIKDLGKN